MMLLLAGDLVPVAVEGPGVCPCCHGATGGIGRCIGCERAAGVLGGLLADAVVPVAVAARGSGLAEALWRYKAPRLVGRERIAVGLAMVLGRFLARHAGCVAAAAGPGAAGFTHTTWVPNRRPGAPVAELVRAAVVSGAVVSGAVVSGAVVSGAVVSGAVPAAVELLALGPVGGRGPDRHRFQVVREAARTVAGGRVLLVDDTWTTGASAQSAAAALKEAGAEVVAIVVVGRHVAPGWAGCVAYLDRQ
ncbi:MAG: hypothetical protein ACYDB7_14160, partial [Mycobacteriales bacterium]